LYCERRRAFIGEGYMVGSRILKPAHVPLP
jgi:hypothetical protein